MLLARATELAGFNPLLMWDLSFATQIVERGRGELSMTESTEARVTQRRRDDLDLVRHHYNRRALWGTDTVLYRKNHPMEWTRVSGNYQNWELDTSSIAPTHGASAEGGASAATLR